MEILIRSHLISTLELVISEDGTLRFPLQSTNFFELNGVEEIELLRAWLHSLPNGKIISCRGRDILRDEEGNFVSFAPWCLGYALKMNRRLFLLWDNEVESILIDGCNFIDQLQFESSSPSFNTTNFVSKNKFLVICHGFCEEYGPNYPFLSALVTSLGTVGYRVIVPDFRPSYKYGPSRGRSERVRIILDEILWCLGNELRRVGEEKTDQIPFPSPEFILIGHSQGGAAVGQLCNSEKAVVGANIRGIAMIGSESPVEHLPTDINSLCGLLIDSDDPPSPPILIHADPPSAIPLENILCIHSHKDRVIHPLMIEQLAERWGCRFVELHSAAQPDHPNVEWADDVQHDFIAKDLLLQVIEMIANFAQNC